MTGNQRSKQRGQNKATQNDQKKLNHGGQNQTKHPSNRGNAGQYNQESNQYYEEMFQSPTTKQNAAHKNEPYNRNQQGRQSRESHDKHNYGASNCQDHAPNQINDYNGRQGSFQENNLKKNRGNGNSHQYVNNSQESEIKKKKNDERNMNCVVCKEHYNSRDHLPRVLSCGHTVCTSCINNLLRTKPLFCPMCRQKGTRQSANDVPINFVLLELLENIGKGNHFAPAEGCNPSGSYSSTRNNSSKKSSNDNWPSAPPGPKVYSPHASKCLEAGAAVSSYCVKCQVWVCSECGKIDHRKVECYLTSADDTVSEMKQVNKCRADDVYKSLRETSNEIGSYREKLEACLTALHVTEDCIKREQKRLEDVLHHGKAIESELQSVVADLSGVKNVPKVLDIFKTVNDSISATQQWASNNDLTPMDQNANILVKELLCTVVQLHSASASGPHTGVLASATINSTPVFSKLVCEGRRIHMHSLQQLQPASKMRAVPLTFVKFCINNTSALTFLDLSWGGSPRGRVYIRLVGNTVRGRQFLKLCTGEMGPSFHSSHFHRVWWKGLPGEHIWGGDYDHGDGSGGTYIMESTENEKLYAFGRKSTVIAGLVAGCYEKKKPSSLFRIYTKDDKSADEEAAFGQVECGLNVIESALNQNNIKDVIISDCGVVIET